MVRLALDKVRAQEEHLNTLVREQKIETEKLEEELDVLRKDSSADIYTVMEEKDQVIAQLRAQLKEHTDILLAQQDQPEARSIDINDVGELKSTLKAKEASLENAKMLIASLENANGSMAKDMRAKLRNREERVMKLEREASDRNKTLESLGTELRALRVEKSQHDEVSDELQKQVRKQRNLTKKLEKTVAELQSVAIVHESTAGSGLPDDGMVERVSSIICDTLMTLKLGLDPDEDVTSLESSTGDEASFPDVDPKELGRHVDALIQTDRQIAALELRHDLKAKSAALKRSETHVDQYKDEVDRLSKENSRLKAEKRDTQEKMSSEIQQLRNQYQTNLKALSKKDRELRVLRDSLEVGEGMGYISGDDESDTDELDAMHGVSGLEGGGYNGTQTQALATLLVHSSDGVELARNMDSSLQHDLVRANTERAKAVRDLQTEKEALSNAKMIISSLEKANKTMLEDLRSRLHDSNSAIASLLDKSQESEKASTTLREKVKQLEREKQVLSKEHAELIKLRVESTPSQAAKETETKKLRNEMKKSAQNKDTEEPDGFYDAKET